MYKIICFSHGTLSMSLIETAEMILGTREYLESYSITPGCDVEKVIDQIALSIKSSEENSIKTLILTDLFFGTPFNQLIQLSERHNFYHVTGVNLPLLLEAINIRDQEVSDPGKAITQLIELAKEGIQFLNNLLDEPEEGEVK